MNSGKIKSLKLQRNSQRNETPSEVQLQDDSMTLAEEAKSHVQRVENTSKQQESLTPVHSTPKRSNGSQDQSNLEYRVSPISLPCTQDGGIEVAWDWHSPITKSKNRKGINNVESSRTPKRTTALQKKRSSNSPLLYKPIKRQLMKDPQQLESLDKFAAEIKALSEHIKAAPKEEQRPGTTDENYEKDEDELLIQIDISDFEGEPKFEVTANDERSSTKNVLKTSLDDLFDDSIDDSMVKCSQEVEEKLKLESRTGNFSQSNSSGSNGAKDFSWHQRSYSRYVAERDKSGDVAGNSRLTVSTSSKNSSNGSKATTSPNEAKKFVVPSASSSSSSTYPKSESKTSSSATTSSTSSSGYPRNETKTSSSATTASSSLSVTSESSVNKFNLVPTKPSSFSVKVPSNAAKISNLPKKVPTTEAKTSSVTTSTISSKSSFINNNANQSSKESSKVEASSLEDIFEIPDDSFDEFLAVCFDDVEESPSSTVASSKNNQEANQSTGRYGKSYDGPSSARSGGTSNTPKCSLQLPQASGNSFKGPSSLRKDSTAAKVFPRSVSNDSINPTPNIAPPTSVPLSQISSVASQGRKFFKSKSHSTSSFDDSATKNVSNSSSTSKGWKTNLFLNGNISVSTEQQKNHQQNTSQNNACSRTNGNVGNTGMYNVNRNGPKEDDNNRYKREVATGSQAQQICTPAEIERKRMEAKMRLEAKKKMMARSTSAGTLSGGTLKRPDKR